MRVAILAAGTRGDLQPILAIAAELIDRGHSVTVAVNSDLAAWVAMGGVEVVPTELDVGRFLHSPEAQRFLANGRAGTAMRQITAHERTVNSAIAEACISAAEGADLVLTTMMMGYRGLCIERATGIPSRTVFTFPMHDTADWASVLSPVRDLRLGWANRASARLSNQLLWSQHRRNLDEMCDTTGVSRFRPRPRLEERASLHVYSAELAPPGGLDPRHKVVGWATLSSSLRRRLGEADVPRDLDQWLDAGPPPVYFGFGSMPVLEPAQMLRDLVEITERLQIRALVGAGWTDYGATAADLPDHLYLATAEFDHDQVLPRCRAAVHHGGAGTTGAVLRAGLPSVVASVFADQPFWGWRIAQAGIGVTLPFRKLTSARLAAALERALKDGPTQRAAVVGAAVRNEDGTRAAADTIERWTSEPRPASV